VTIRPKTRAGQLVLITSNTDFAAKTAEFIAFSGKVAMMAYAVKAENWDTIIEAVPEMEEERLALQKSLRETITIEQISVMSL